MHLLNVVFYPMGVCAEVKGSTDTVNKHPLTPFLPQGSQL